MKSIFFLSLFVFVILASCTSDPSDLVNEELPLGKNDITLVQRISDTEDDILFLNLHEDETTSIEALEKFAEETPINYLYLSHSGERRITFKHKRQLFSIDPNRIFTDAGRKKTLTDGGNYTEKGEREVRKFAKKFLKRLQDKTAIVAMHNNTDSNYSILSYLPDGDEAQNTKHVYINDNMDPDDFIYTTDEQIYKAMVKRNVNVILQDNANFVDDGSLSVYCGIEGIRYINIETEHGHLNEQLDFMQLLDSLLRE